MSAPDEVYRSYFDLRWHFNPAAATSAGFTGENGRLGSFDSESMRAHLAAFRAMMGAVEELAPDDLQAEIDRTAVLGDVRSTIFRFTYEEPHIRNPAFWLGHLYQSLYALLDRPEGTPAERAGWMLERLRGAAAFLRSAQETLRDPPRVFLDTAAAMVEGGGVLLGQAAAFCRDHLEPGGEAVEQAAGDAEAALARFGLALGTELAASSTETGFAVGEDQFNRRLHHEHALNATAPELWRYGMHLVEETEGELVKLAARIEPGTPWRSLVERLRGAAPVEGDPVAVYREEIERSLGFVRERELMTIPEGPLVVLPTPGYLRPLIPIAAYTPPGEYSQDRTGRFYVTSGARPGRTTTLGTCRYELPTTALHEGYPGHHLQLLRARDSASEVRRVIWTPLTVEGWALYCEDMMGEEGYYRSPEERLFQRLHLLWRAVRIILDIGLHTRSMSPAAAIVFLMDKVPMDYRDAEAEVRRYCAYPTYQQSYAVGRREIRALRDDWRARAGGAYRLRAFHDDLLQYGGLPVSLIRWGMGLESGE